MYGNDFMRYKEVRDALNADAVDVVNSPPHYKAGGIEAIKSMIR